MAPDSPRFLRGRVFQGVRDPIGVNRPTRAPKGLVRFPTEWPPVQDDDPRAIKKSCMGLFLGALAVTLFLSVGYYYYYSKTHFSQSVLTGYEKTLFSPSVKSSGSPRNRGGEGVVLNVDLAQTKARRRGRILPITPGVFNLEGSTPAVHEVWHKLNPDVRALPGGEVGTVVFCRVAKAVVGRYTNGASAWAEMTSIWSFDARTGEYLGTATYCGRPPDKLFVANSVGVGQADLLGGLNGLPEAR